MARQYRAEKPREQDGTLSDKIVRYMSEHTDAVTLKDIAARFSYHPNYISALLHRELGKTFSEILLEQKSFRHIMYDRKLFSATMYSSSYEKPCLEVSAAHR